MERDNFCPAFTCNFFSLGQDMMGWSPRLLLDNVFLTEEKVIRSGDKFLPSWPKDYKIEND